MRRMLGLLVGGWFLLSLLLLQGSMLNQFRQVTSTVLTDAAFPLLVEQTSEGLASPIITEPNGGNAPLHFEEAFTSTQFLAYTVGADWNTLDHQLALQLQDNVGQQAVTVASARLADASTPYLYLVWQDLRNDGGDIYAQKLDAKGHRLWPHDRRINSDDGSATQASPTAVVDMTGNLFVVWVDDRTGNNDIYAQSVSPQGEALWVEDIRIHDETGTAEQGAPMLTTHGSGLAVVAWHDNREGDYNVYLQQVDARGARLWATDRRVNQDTSLAAQTYPAVSAAADGTILIGWLDQRIGNGDLYLQRVSAQGDCLWAQEIRVNQASEQATNRPALIQLTGGTSVISWLDPLDNHVYLQSFDQQGNQRWAKTLRANQSDQPANAERAPALAPLASGLIITWERAHDPALYAQSISDQGAFQWPGERRVSSDPGMLAANAGFIAIAAIDEQRVAVAWSDQRNHASGDIYAQSLNLAGDRGWTYDVQVNDAAGTVDQTLVDIATTAAGISTLVWQDQRAGAVAQLYLQRVMPDGQPLWSQDIPVPQIGPTHYAQRAPKVANLGDDTFVAWSDLSSGVARIYLQRLDAAGNRMWTRPQQVSSGSSDQNNPALAINQQGDLFVAWETTQAGTTQLALLRLNANGEPQWPTPTNLYNGAEPARLPDLAVDTTGNVYATWLVTTAEGTDVYLQKINQAGSPAWSAPILVNGAQGLVNRFNPPALATTAEGDSIVVWVDNRQSGVFAQRLDPTGQKLWATEILLNATPGSFSPMPALAITPDRGAVVVWQGLQQGISVINAQRITAAGDPLWNGGNSVEVAVSNGSLRAAMPRIALDSNGLASIVWRDERRNNFDIFMQTLDTAGQRGWPADVAVSQPDRFYQTVGTAESLTLDRIEEPIRQATLTADIDLRGGTMDFAITNDGTTWQSVQLGTRLVFTTTGSDLRWRVQLHPNPHDPAASPVIRTLQIDYYTATPSAAQDAYEGDDGCGLAQALQINGPAQQHALTTQSGAQLDEDWLHLTARAGQPYILWAAPNHRDAALQLEVYATCGAAATATVRAVAGQSAILSWMPDHTSTHFVRVLSTHTPLLNEVRMGQQTPLGYQIGIRQASTPGLAILVAGRLPAGDANQTVIDQTVDRVYQKLQQHGYAPSQIHYLGRATGVTQAALQNAIQSWVVAQQTTAPATGSMPLFIYLAGRGNVGQFYLNETERITPALLNSWLANLEAHAPIHPIVIMLEAGQAGSFITTNPGMSDTGTLAAPNRILVTATSAQGSAWRSSQGLLFSDIFWSNLAIGHPVQQSFQMARQAVQEAGYFCQNAAAWCQEPWLDDTGRGLPNPALMASLAHGQGLALPITEQGPQIQTVTTAWDKATQTLSIEAQVVVSNSQNQVEAHLIPAAYQPILVENEAFPALQHPIVVLHKTAEAPLAPLLQRQTYRGTYQIPDGQGDFWVSVHAWDSAGVFAVPFGVQFQNGFYTYLPLVSR